MFSVKIFVVMPAGWCVFCFDDMVTGPRWSIGGALFWRTYTGRGEEVFGGGGATLTGVSDWMRKDRY